MVGDIIPVLNYTEKNSQIHRMHEVMKWAYMEVFQAVILLQKLFCHCILVIVCLYFLIFYGYK